ncbi:SIR2 family protein [Aeromonas salmonicida]|uniref:SIR2 family protein n=1 Tax=Aeromonas salmonicida TaxID=645 RepID=UPI000F795A5E|nr:SIR2 family protein [Aeromonas salmonicida]RSM29262.1 hypothetical protein C5B77_13335 [Aeromonas salmonicida]
MGDTLLFGNGINRVSDNSVSWDELLDKIKGVNRFLNGNLPNTMVYERIFMEKNISETSQKADEIDIKKSIAEAMKSQESNEIFEALKLLDVEHYLTTNYDYAFEKALRTPPEHLSTEDIYSLRRKRKYSTQEGVKYLWNIHGEIDHPKSIMLGLDHYCGSVSKIESYVKGTYKYTIDGEVHNVSSMVMKLESSNFCLTSWIDLFFSSNVHIIGLSLDYSETDLWWLLNKRARLSTDGLVKNKIYFYTQKFEQQKADLLKSFNVIVVNINLIENNYKEMYRSAIGNMNIKPKNSAAA